MLNRKRAGLLGLFGLGLFLAAVEPATAQSTESTITEGLIWGLNEKLVYAAVPITVLVEGILIYTVWKFSKNDEAKPTQENRRLEITWTIATAIILLFVGVATYQVLGSPYVSAGSQQAIEEPGNVEEIEVYGQKYVWNFEYSVDAEGVTASDLTLENVTLDEATVTNTSGDGIQVEDAEVSGEKIESGTLFNGVVTGLDNETRDSLTENETETFSDVTVESATISDATIQNGTVSSSETMKMPANREVTLNITSNDWLHSFHAPGLGLKQDAFPGEWNQIRTKATETGEHQLYCAEYCGSGHSDMLGQVEVVSQEEYREWKVDTWLEDQQ
ncbi:cytochrome c oxidase subunit II [Halorientalis salina]|uniref:cytochrome c oxidase subunit II n=1 Tax=Halorientalis salina TaxID=2932266 RepID=UPI002022B0C3|nr:cytochrome c oxidase subunit II transmembrane domain-containing protein [Halorientalis salina]